MVSTSSPAAPMTSQRSQSMAPPPSPGTPAAASAGPGPSVLSPQNWWHTTTSRCIDLRLWLTNLYENNIGLLLIAASQLFMAFVNVAVKALNGFDRPVPTLELVFVRMFITYCFSMTYMIIWKIPHAVLGPPEVRGLLVFRGISGFFGLFGVYYSLKYLTLSDAVVLTFLAPTTTALAGYVFLRETLSRREVFAGLFSLLGVVLIARPRSLFGVTAEHDALVGGSEVSPTAENATPTQRLVAVGVAMIGVGGATGAYISLRAIGTKAHTMHSLTFFSSYSVIVASLGMLLLRVRPVIPTRLSWCGLLAAVGIFGFIAQVLLVTGLQRETASRGTLALYIQIIYAYVLERIIFKTTPSYLSLLGTVIIIGSALYVALTKDKNPDSYKRVPQSPDDLESHEFAEITESSGNDGPSIDHLSSRGSPLDGETLLNK